MNGPSDRLKDLLTHKQHHGTRHNTSQPSRRRHHTLPVGSWYRPQCSTPGCSKHWLDYQALFDIIGKSTQIQAVCQLSFDQAKSAPALTTHMATSACGRAKLTTMPKHGYGYDRRKDTRPVFHTIVQGFGSTEIASQRWQRNEVHDLDISPD